MSDQYLGEIRMFSGAYAPQGWHFCDGTTLSIQQYEALYSIIGTVYGGDGKTNFQLPDLRGRVPIHTASAYPMGQMAGSEQVTLVESNLPVHTHTANANNVAADATSTSPEGQYWGYNSTISSYQNANPNVTMSTAAISAVGGNQPHDNMMPSMATTFIIALEGNYPTQG